MAGVLDKIKILDLSRGIAGPMATMVLSESGAEVIKIEGPAGDPNRDTQLGYHVWQRGKRCACYDLKDSAELDLFYQLVRSADILVESYSPGVAKKLGVDFESLQRINPALIVCSITGYGRDTPYSDRPAVDALVSAKLGLHYEQRGRVGAQYHVKGGEVPFADIHFTPDSVVGPRHEDRDGPLFTGTYWPSLGAAYAAMTSINAALLVRQKTGLGQWVETSLMQGALTAGTLAYSYGEFPHAPHFSTWINDSRSPRGNFECADGRWIINWVPNPRFVLGASRGNTLNPAPDMSSRDDPDRIMPAMDDMLVLDHYYPQLTEAFKKFTADEWVAAGEVAGQCIQKIRTPEEALSDELFLQDGCVAKVDDPKYGTTHQVGSLYSLENHKAHVKQGYAVSGEHTDEVRQESAGHIRTSDQFGSALLKQPLEGVTVIDLGLAIAGPFGAQLLSDLGARVIKVNATYDWYWHSNAIAMSANRGKDSIAINMRDPQGVEIIKQLISKADVVIHNMRYKAVESKGLDYASLRESHPELIYCHTRGFEKSRREKLPGNDQTGSALAGVQWEDGACGDGGRPYWSLTTLGDTGNGYLAANAIIQALLEREKTGRGQFVDTSIVNAHLFNTSHILAKEDGGAVQRPHMSRDALGFSAGYRLYKTLDDYICIALSENQHWDKLFELLRTPELRYDERFNSASARSDNDHALTELLMEHFQAHSAAEWFNRLDGVGIPCEVANSKFSRDMWQSDSFLLDRNWLSSFPHPVVGTIGQVGVPYDFSATPALAKSGPLIVGKQTRAILSELGYDEARQAKLFEQQIVADESSYRYPLETPTS
ncbi:CaiB/BaiF CoA transferase family protein [Microbulbifer spongiae]|uniref:CoA transferase n=1 Tax=Microbulbifer spongiae TaxID=2944933 RepID=A0ABY9EAU1_9GAMM|nr:CoA transferase [Microbulbifer sp. MI-G]WKD49036.1 CoA transferase [Microbulbifer sp. MI-G]